MPKHALQQLVDTARNLPGEKAPVPVLSVPPPSTDAPAHKPDVRLLRRQLGQLLQELARILEPELTRALGQAARSWDQVDAVSVLSPLLVERIEKHKAQWQLVRADGDAATEAAAVEAILTLDAAVELVSLLEKRLATLIRLRVRAEEDAPLLPDNRPFLDVPAALQHAARAWT